MDRDKNYADWYTLQHAIEGLPIYDHPSSSEPTMVFIGFKEDEKGVALFYEPSGHENGLTEIARQSFNEGSWYVEATSRIIPIFTARRDDGDDEFYDFVLVKWPEEGWRIHAGCRDSGSHPTLAAVLEWGNDYWCDDHAVDLDNDDDVAKEIREIVKTKNGSAYARVMLNRETRKLINKLGAQAGYKKTAPIAKAAMKRRKR